MKSARGPGIFRYARLSRRQIITFALLSAAFNGLVTASVGAWLGQTYAKYQARKQSIEGLVHLVYERRTRAGMVASALRRNADTDEVRYRKRAYDEAYVSWNKNIMQNLFVIREVTGEHMISSLEGYFQDGLVAAMADVDRCLTKAYDARLSNLDPLPVLDACRMADAHQFVLDCGATFTNELYKLSKLSFLPFQSYATEGREVSERRIKGSCEKPPKPVATPPVVPAPSAATPAPVSTAAPASPPPQPVSKSAPETPAASPK